MENKRRADSDWPRGFDEHRTAQIVRMAKHSTAEQRVRWVEEMLDLMAKTGLPYNDRKHRERARTNSRS